MLPTCRRQRWIPAPKGFANEFIGKPKFGRRVLEGEGLEISGMNLDPKQITTRIYQGGWLRAEHVPELVHLGVTHVLNLDAPYTDHLPLSEANITIHNLPIRDYCLMTPQRVREIMEVIDGCLSSPSHKIYIHCVAGVSRSPTIAWLYLIHTGFSPRDALSIVKPNPALYDEGIIQQLTGDCCRRLPRLAS
jgi:hypothetical protein